MAAKKKVGKLKIPGAFMFDPTKMRPDAFKTFQQEQSLIDLHQIHQMCTFRRHQNKLKRHKQQQK